MSVFQGWTSLYVVATTVCWKCYVLIDWFTFRYTETYIQSAQNLWELNLMTHYDNCLKRQWNILKNIQTKFISICHFVLVVSHFLRLHSLFKNAWECFCREELHDSEVSLLTTVLNLFGNPAAREEGTDEHMSQNFTVNVRLCMPSYIDCLFTGSERWLGLAWTSWTAGPARNKRR